MTRSMYHSVKTVDFIIDNGYVDATCRQTDEEFINYVFKMRFMSSTFFITTKRQHS